METQKPQQGGLSRVIRLIQKGKFTSGASAGKNCDACANRGSTMLCPNVGCEGAGAAAWCRSFTEKKNAA